MKVTPAASSEGVVGWLGDALKIRVRAPAERGKANAAVTRVLAEALGIPLADVRIASGHGSSRKLVEIEGLGLEQIRQRVALPRPEG